ncbi:hypothetical protein SNEBB_001294, partial [Seison nebaliae]
MESANPLLYFGDVSDLGERKFQLIQVDYDDLMIDKELSLGDPVKCECQAILSRVSEKNIKVAEDKTEWTCEYCGHVNDISLFPRDQIMSICRSGASMTYNLEVIIPKEKDEVTNKEETRSTMILFVIDISGSMGVYVPGRHISLLEAVKRMTLKAIKYQYDNFPNNKLSLMTFGTWVTCCGDFSKNGHKTKSGTDMDKNDWTDFSSKFVEPLPIQTSYNNMVRQVRSLRCQSSTALGPALYSAVRYASRVRGSRIVVLTDGEANVGLGMNGDTQFYQDVGTMANECGVIVDLMSVEDCHCNLKDVAPVALMTEGDVKMFDPKIDSEIFTEILKVEQIATNVETKFIIPKGFRVIEATNEEENIKVIEQGNVMPEIIETFEMEFKNISPDNIAKWNKKKIPYQTQVVYRKMDGNKYIRVYTAETEGRKESSTLKHDNSKVWSNHFRKVRKNGLKHNLLEPRSRRGLSPLSDELHAAYNSPVQNSDK